MPGTHLSHDLQQKLVEKSTNCDPKQTLLDQWVTKRPTPPKKFFVVTGTYGSGKSTLIRDVMKANDEYGVPLLHTTRDPWDMRPLGPLEKDGVHYHFVNKCRFLDMIENNELIEWEISWGEYYGLSYEAVEAARKDKTKKAYFIEVNMQGVDNFKQWASQKGDDWAIVKYIFMYPSTQNVNEKQIQIHWKQEVGLQRIRTLPFALYHASTDNNYYDYHILNREYTHDDWLLEIKHKERRDVTYNHFKAILTESGEYAEELSIEYFRNHLREHWHKVNIPTHLRNGW